MLHYRGIQTKKPQCPEKSQLLRFPSIRFGKKPSTRISTHPSFPSPFPTAGRRLKKGEIFSLSSFGKEGGPPPQAAYYARRKRSLATHFFLRQRTRKKEICIKKISRILDGNSARERRSNERPQLRILYKLCSIIRKLIFPTLSA